MATRADKEVKAGNGRGSVESGIEGETLWSVYQWKKEKTTEQVISLCGKIQAGKQGCYEDI